MPLQQALERSVSRSSAEKPQWLSALQETGPVESGRDTTRWRAKLLAIPPEDVGRVWHIAAPYLAKAVVQTDPVRMPRG